MKSLRVLKAAGLVLAALVLGLMTAQTSYALWNAGTGADAGTIQSASFDVVMDNGTGPVLMTQADGSQGTLSLNVGTINAGSATYTDVRLTNNSDAGGSFTISVSAGAAQVSSFPELWTIQHRAVSGTDPGACNAALFTGDRKSVV